MRREIPLLIAFLTGMAMILKFFVPTPTITWIGTELPNWNTIIGAFALFLGLASLVGVHGNRISRRDEGWMYSVVLLVSLGLTLFFGFRYGAEEYYREARQLSEADRTVVVEAATAFAAIKDTKEQVAFLGKVMPTAGKILGITRTETLKSNLRTIADQGIDRREGAEGTPYQTGISYSNPFHWMYMHIYNPLQSTMFSILAFYVASAAYRAFRARTVEGTLLLIAAFLVMIGRVSVGYLVSCNVSWLPFPAIQEWIMDIPTAAGQRAVMIGAALGVISSSLRMLLGYEQTYLGSE